MNAYTNQDAYVLGIDVGGTNIKLALAPQGGDEILARVITDEIAFNSVANGKKESFSAALAGAVLRFLKKRSISLTHVRSIGLSIPGRVDYVTGQVLYAYNLGFKNVDIREEIISNFPSVSTVTVMNDADAAAYAEFKAGALKGYKNGCLITIGTGIGAGFIIDGKLFAGGKGRGTEFGHAIMDMSNGNMCSCGTVGCVESMCSATYLERLAYETLHERLDAKRIFDLYANGEARIAPIVAQYLENLACMLITVVNTFDPEIIALGGGVSQAGDLIISPIRASVNERCFFENAGNIVACTLGSFAGAIGAALHSFDFESVS